MITIDDGARGPAELRAARAEGRDLWWAVALFALPFAPLFCAGIFVFHTWMGYLRLAGTVVLMVPALANQRTTRRPLEAAAQAAFAFKATGAQIRQEAETIQSLGIRGVAFGRRQGARGRALAALVTAADEGGAYAALIRAFRLIVRTAMLALGALLVLDGEMTTGAMIAGFILLGRALAPIETMVGQWAVLARARETWRNLATLLGEVPDDARRAALPRPMGRIEFVI